VKVSIVLFFIRVLPAVDERKKALYLLAAFIGIEEMAFTIAMFLQCLPMTYYWDKTVEGRCFNQQAFYYCDASFNLATDLVILSLPWVLFKSMQYPSVAALLSILGMLTLILHQNSMCRKKRNTLW
jgi:hypothetical protein